MGTILILGGVIVLFGFGWTGIQLFRSGPGPDRDALEASNWMLGGSGVLLLALAMGVEPFTLPLVARVVTLALSLTLTGVGSVKARRLAEARRQHLLTTAQTATTLPERLEALEARHALERGPPVRLRITLLGGKLFLAWTMAWAASVMWPAAPGGVFGAFAVAAVAWASLDLRSIVGRRREERRRDEEVDALLTPPPEGGI